MALPDLLAPTALEFRRADVIFGDQVARVMTVLDYAPRVGPAWLARLATLPATALSVHLVPTDSLALLKALNQSIQEYLSRLAQGGNALVQSRWEQSLNDAKTLLKQIDQESRSVYRVAVLLLVVAPNEEELGRRCRQVEAACVGSGMRSRTAVFRQDDGLRAAGPWGMLPREMEALCAREMTSLTIAASYPWVAAGLNHGHGTVWGRDDSGGLVLLDRWAPPEGAGLTNANVNIFGMPGGGKTYASMIQILREYAQGARVLVVDPESEYAPRLAKLGARVVDVAGGHGRINPLQVPLVPDTDDEDDEASYSPLMAHIQRLKAFFELYLPGTDDLERALLEKAARAAYDELGITPDTDPAVVCQWPTIADVHRQAASMGVRSERLAVLLESAAEGADSVLWTGQSTVEIGGSDLVVLDIKRLKEAAPNVRRAQFFNVLNYAWDMVREGRALGKRTCLVVDEAWIMIDPQAPQALQFLFEMSKRIRKYGPKPVGGSLTVSTQNIGDFLSPEVARQGQPVVTNAGIKLLMRQDPADLEKLRQPLRLTDAECDLLASARRGEGLLLAGNQHVRVRIEAAPHEIEIIG